MGTGLLKDLNISQMALWGGISPALESYREARLSGIYRQRKTRLAMDLDQWLKLHGIEPDTTRPALVVLLIEGRKEGGGWVSS